LLTEAQDIPGEGLAFVENYNIELMVASSNCASYKFFVNQSPAGKNFSEFRDLLLLPQFDF